jgi:ribonucleoside-diphosphate reductase alpha chain
MMCDLNALKQSNEAPQWMNEESIKTLSAGYLLKDETPRQMYKRLARTAASYYKDGNLEERFFAILWKNWLCPSSPIVANFGTERGMPISCNSLSVPDSINGIFMKNHELAVLSKNGAGVGIYFGDIRGRQAPIKGNGTSEGIVPWCKVFDTTIMSVSQGCYDDQTEVLTENGWEKFSSLVQNTKVAQVSKVGELSFTDFTDYICYPVKENLYHFSNKTQSIDLLITSNHRMAIEKRRRISNKRDVNGKFLSNAKTMDGHLSIVEAKDLMPHRDNRFWVAPRNTVGKKETLSVLDRFLIAYQADGSSKPSGSSTGAISGNLLYAFRFRKERKITRLTEIINELGWGFSVNIQRDGTTSFLVQVPLSIHLSKKLSDVFDLTTFSSEYAKQFISEVSLWDGSVCETGISYSCVVQENVDFVQAIAILAGKMATLGTPSKKEEHHQIRHHVYICDRNSVGGEEMNKTTKYYEGNVYCITVPTGLLVVRRKGAAAICGNSTRRGASAIYLPIDHSDINEFINIRRPTGDINRRCLNINHGVCITDDWMRSMIDGNKENRKTWEEILKTRIETGEPYLFFTDNVNKNNPECYVKNGLTVKCSNICSEIALHTDPDHTFVCCLSSLNLVKYDEWKDTDAVELSVMFLDAVLSEYIQKTETMKGMEASRLSAIKGRAIGLGVLGWHTLLQERNIPFDHFDAMQLNAEIFRNIRSKAENETKRLAAELGEPEWCKGFNRRHTHLLACAPTVSNSIISGGYSAGIEPISANIFTQKSAKGTFIRKNTTLEKLLESKGKNTLDTWRSINEKNGSVQQLSFLSEQEKQVFLTAREINQFSIIKQAIQRQKWVDQAQSVNLFFATNASPKYIHQVHLAAWEGGLKTLYYLRSDGVIKGDMASRDKNECAACEA